MRRGFKGRVGPALMLVATVLAFIISSAGVLVAGSPASDAKTADPTPSVAAPAAPTVADTAPEYAGTSTCVDCHSKYDRKMTETSHRTLFTLAKKGAEVRGCESCHGPSKAHAESDGKVLPAVSFRAKTKAEIKAVNKSCLACHREEKLAAFENKGHGRNGRTSCLSCHSMHKAKFDTLLSAKDPAACYTCHPGQRSQMNMPSHHPIREGKMQCSGCHNPHGSPSGTRTMLARETVNETCLKCHSNLAGPWTFEHVPAAKDCLICHRPHGSVNQQLLTQPETTLCVRCHNPQHAGFANRTNRDRSLQRQLAYQSCYNCHSMIHGSDNDHGFNN